MQYSAAQYIAALDTVQVSVANFSGISGNNGGNPQELSKLTFFAHYAAGLGTSALSVAPIDPNEDGLVWTNDPAEDGSLAITRLQGDYDFNGVVNMGDYVVWRNSRGSSVQAFTGADGDGNGVVDSADCTVWRNHFGETFPGAGYGTAMVAVASGNVSPASQPIADMTVAVPAIASQAVEQIAPLTSLPHDTLKHSVGQSVRDEAVINLVRLMAPSCSQRASCP